MFQETSILELIETKKEKFISLSDRVFDTPETLYMEYKSVREHTICLEAELFKNPALIHRAKQEHQQKILEKPYRCPIPPDISPPLITQSLRDD